MLFYDQITEISGDTTNVSFFVKRKLLPNISNYNVQNFNAFRYILNSAMVQDDVLIKSAWLIKILNQNYCLLGQSIPKRFNLILKIKAQILRQ